MKALKKIYDWLNLCVPYVLGTLILLILVLGGIGVVIQLSMWIMVLVGVM